MLSIKMLRGLCLLFQKKKQLVLIDTINVDNINVRGSIIYYWWSKIITPLMEAYTYCV